jgi:hypothetical protein
MRISTFSFKNEAIWMIVFSFAPAVIAAIVLIVVYLLR